MAFCRTRQVGGRPREVNQSFMSGAALSFREAVTAMPLVAILRGLSPQRAANTVRVLVTAGFRVIEIPLNRDDALDALRCAVEAAPENVVIGAGTVLTPEAVRAAKSAGARLIVTPNLDAAVMAEGRALDLPMVPGVLTPTEALAAVEFGAEALKLFPAEVVGPAGLKALRAVLPASMARIFAVGGVTPETMRAWRDAGADGFGVGSALFAPGFDDREVAARAAAFVAAWRSLGGQA